MAIFNSFLHVYQRIFCKSVMFSGSQHVPTVFFALFFRYLIRQFSSRLGSAPDIVDRCHPCWLRPADYLQKFFLDVPHILIVSYSWITGHHSTPKEKKERRVRFCKNHFQTQRPNLWSYIQTGSQWGCAEVGLRFPAASWAERSCWLQGLEGLQCFREEFSKMLEGSDDKDPSNFTQQR